jgi:RNA polymerase sigma-54 factor
MALAAKLQLRQSQALVMTPQLMQSIRLLQMTHAELQTFIDEEIERNPLLERSGGDEPSSLEPTPEPTIEAGDDWYENDLLPSAEAIAERFDSSMENVFPDEPGKAESYGPSLTEQWRSSGAGNGPGGAASDGFDLDDLAASKVTLRDHVREQIALAFPSAADRIIAAELAEELDEIGYMRGEVSEIASRLGATRLDVQRVLGVCQGFTPTGLFARSLAECLSLQLAERDRLDPAMTMMLANLELIARRDIATLKRLCGVSSEDVLDMMGEIRNLDPRPGTAFTVGVAEAVVPDVVVKPASDGSWLVELNPDALPRVLVDNVYFARVQGQARNQNERDFLSECLQSANWLARSLDQRAKTMLKVASEIVKQQDAFLAHGVRHLRPLNLKTVADAIGMHESTVSRVTASKFMHTPRGMLELRYFFTAAIASAEGGESHSSESVRDRIRELVDAEKPHEVLSDDAIVDILKGNGVDIARRTVAKYREGLRIPSSVERRREKQAVAALGR